MVPSLWFPQQDSIHPPLLTHTRHMPSPSHSSRFYHPHNIGWGVQMCNYYSYLIKMHIRSSPWPVLQYLLQQNRRITAWRFQVVFLNEKCCFCILKSAFLKSEFSASNPTLGNCWNQTHSTKTAYKTSFFFKITSKRNILKFTWNDSRNRRLRPNMWKAQALSVTRDTGL